MILNTKGVLSLGLIAAAALSQASLSYSNIVATVTFDGTTTYNLNVLQDANSITFTSVPPMLVTTQNGFAHSAVVNISYDVNSSKGINGLDLIFTGQTLGNGNVGFEENVFDGSSNLIATVSGNKNGNNAFTEEDFLSFQGGAQNFYSVNKSFTLDLTGPQNETVHNFGISQVPSMASVGLIEQNAVPEPATLGAVGVGLLGLLRRRRK